ncbi:MAG: alpha-1,4-glucan--maltose-1-phosphate maltosyltransferase [Verrucomicrobia bacterium]|nr:alpha-1,4-glucan--maltose-1-phosphate maltosyltransferase [Verrucomicrobiota bacterium]
MTLRPSTVTIENLQPLDEGGRYPLKRIVGDTLRVEADIFKDGHDLVSARLKWRKLGEKTWHCAPMRQIPNGNDRWQGEAAFFENARFEYTIEAWSDAFRSWQHEFELKFKAAQPDLKTEILEGALIVQNAAAAARKADHTVDAKRLTQIASEMRQALPAEVYALAHLPELEALMATYPDLSEAAELWLDPPATRPLVEAPPFPRFVPRYPKVIVDRKEALYAAWYEFFPRSAEGRGDRGSTFRDCIPRVEDAQAMGFNVIYFPPIHPIGLAARKGRNNAVSCEPGEPGVPYAIGNRHQDCPNGGGHCDVAPELGTLEDFDWLVSEIHARGMEVALDFAINCSPDHPWVAEHPDWFYSRPDGTIKYAENPPKKYQDVYPLNYHNPDWRRLWVALTDVILFWARRGVRIFRVDNPHTKPLALWEFMIEKVQETFPDTVFLSEAFTRPKMMLALAKAGFTQSYTYFTWRNSKQELIQYFTELNHPSVAEFFRPNLWPNTPDILPILLQNGGRGAFLQRAVLATLLSPVYGIYSGFELCECAAIPGKEEYLDSEKYQWKERDWNAPGNIKGFITRLNRIRRENRALHQFRNLAFHLAENEHVLFFSKVTEARDNMLLVAVSLDPWHSHGAFVHVPLELLGIEPDEVYQVHDLLTDERYLWNGSRNYVELHPDERTAHVFRVRRKLLNEMDFETYR